MRMKTLQSLLVMAALTSACAGDAAEEGAAADSSAVATDSAAAVATSGLAQDGQHDFLRAMADHHEGLVQVGAVAMNRASAPDAQMDAHNLHTKQAAERDSLVQSIQRLYQEQYQPRALPQHIAQTDSLMKLSGLDYDRAFYRFVIAHHEEGLRMIEQHASHLTDPAVSQMAQKMKADQQREITEFQRKAGAGR